MKHQIYALMLGAAMTMGMVSCSDDDMYENPSRAIVFTVGAEELKFVSTGATVQLYVEASSAPTASSSESWIQLGSFALNGESTRIYAISVTAAANTGYDVRTGTITIGQGSNSSTVTVTQYAGTGLIVDTTPLSFSNSASDFTISVQATGEYSVSVPSWVTRTTSRALSTYAEAFGVSANRSVARSGEIVFTLIDDPTYTATVSLSQEAYDGTVGTTAKDLVKQINAGWNLGNTLEACDNTTLTGSETMWGNPAVSQNFINSVKAAGFNAIRLPAAWHCHLSDRDNYIIDSAWLDRVQDVVDYCINADMIVVLNTHWDAGWLELNCTSASKDAVIAEETAIWTQIANRFADYSDRLVFAAANEVRSMRNGSEWWGTPNSDEKATLLAYMQTFVDAVRATGGNNETRNLVVQSWCCNGWYAVGSNTYAMPTDVVDDHLIFEFHYYDPQEFTHAGTQTLWGYRAGYVSADDGSQESNIDNFFGMIKSAFVDKGYPVILGEYGTNCWSLDDQTVMDSQAYYLEYINKVAKTNGIATFYWDNGTGDIGNFGLFSRGSGSVVKQHLVDGIIRGASSATYPY